jgi:hypothetical protein
VALYPARVAPNALTVAGSTYSPGHDFTICRMYGAAGLLAKQFFMIG